VIFVSLKETGVVIGPSQRPRFHSVTTSTLGGLTPPTSPYGKSSSVLYPTSGVDEDEHVFISSGGGSIPCIGAVTPKVCSSTGSSPGGTASSSSSHSGVSSKSAMKSSSISNSSANNSRSYYVSLANVPKGKSYRSFPTTSTSSTATTLRSTSASTAGTRLLSSTISPPTTSTANVSASQTACIFPNLFLPTFFSVFLQNSCLFMCICIVKLFVLA
jgi:hypothetical protein